MPPIGVNTTPAVNIGSGGATIGGFTSDVRIDSGRLAAALRGPDMGVQREMLRVAEQVKRRAQQLVGVDTGNLRDHIVTRLEERGDGFRARVGADVQYASYHHEGSDAVEGKLMRFTPKGSDVVVFATRRRAIPGNPFLTDALSQVVGTWRRT